jgi:hypothetical protein
MSAVVQFPCFRLGRFRDDLLHPGLVSYRVGSSLDRGHRALERQCDCRQRLARQAHLQQAPVVVRRPWLVTVPGQVSPQVSVNFVLPRHARLIADSRRFFVGPHRDMQALSLRAIFRRSFQTAAGLVTIVAVDPVDTETPPR